MHAKLMLGFFSLLLLLFLMFFLCKIDVAFLLLFSRVCFTVLLVHFHVIYAVSVQFFFALWLYAGS